jgi:hypothetical protein
MFYLIKTFALHFSDNHGFVVASKNLHRMSQIFGPSYQYDCSEHSFQKGNK